MKRIALSLFATALLLSGCNQNPPATEQSAPGTATQAPEAGAAAGEATSGAPDSTTAAAPAAAAPAATPAASQPVDMVFRFAPMKGEGAGRSTAYLVLSGGDSREIDLGAFAGKPDQVDAAEAKRANFPADMVVGFRSYDPNSGTSNDLAVVPGTSGHVRIVQRRLEEGADKQPEFQTSRELSVPAGAQLRAKK